jgi:hypothetical protein
MTSVSPADAEHFVQQFATGWAMGSRDAFLRFFEPLIDPHVRLEQPPFPARQGWDEFRGFFDELFELIPDLTGEVRGWRPTGTGASVDLELTGTLAGHRIRLLSRDELTLRDGRLLARRAVLGRRGLLRIAAHPSAFPALVRMIRLSR